MARNKDELCLGTRYVHTGNSGVTFNVSRDVKRVDRAILSIRNGAFGAFSTSMEVRGNDYNGMTSRQLRDLALMFMDAAAYLDEGELPLMSESADLVHENGGFSKKRDLPPSIGDLLPYFGTSLNVRGEDLVPALLRDYPDLKTFYAVYADRISKKADDDGVKEVSSETRGKPTKATKLAWAKERLDDHLLGAGVDFLRSWWMAALAKLALASAEEAYDEAYAKHEAGVPEQTSNAELANDPHAIRVKDAGILSR